jgi:hypothetical protein
LDETHDLERRLEEAEKKEGVTSAHYDESKFQVVTANRFYSRK